MVSSSKVENDPNIGRGARHCSGQARARPLRMTTAQEARPGTLPPGPGGDGSPPAARYVGWREVALIGGFWTLFGAVTCANLFLSGIEQTGDATAVSLVFFTFLGAYTWAALTLPAFDLTRRLDLTGDQGAWRVLRVAGLVVFGFLFSLGISLAVAFTTDLLVGDQFGGDLAGPQGLGIMVRYRLPHDLLACLLVLTAGVARDYFFRYRSRLAEATLLRSQLAEARLQVLRAQLNPHFLFNTLNAVAALVQVDPRGVRRMIALLSELLRESLRTASEPEVPLERELELLRRYLDIMEIRFRGRLEARITADADVLHALVPHLILQPLVENSLKHGIGHTSAGGLVEVTAARRHGDLILRVRDSGPRLEVGRARQGSMVQSRSHPDGESGFGLRHTRERLFQLYGERASLDLTSEPGGDTVAEIRLPYHWDGPREVEAALAITGALASEPS